MYDDCDVRDVPDGDATCHRQAMDAESHGLFAFAKLVVDQG
jgi:uncharacterized protein YbaA (DUF1428 family)